MFVSAAKKHRGNRCNTPFVRVAVRLWPLVARLGVIIAFSNALNVIDSKLKVGKRTVFFANVLRLQVRNCV